MKRTNLNNNNIFLKQRQIIKKNDTTPINKKLPITKEEEEEIQDDKLLPIESLPIVQNIEQILKDLNQTPKELFIKQLIYSKTFIFFFLNISQHFCQNNNKRYILLNESREIKYNTIWEFHNNFWLNFHLENEYINTTNKLTTESYNFITLQKINEYFSPFAFQLKFITHHRHKQPLLSSSSSLVLDSLLINIIFHPNMNRINKFQSNLNSIVLDIDALNRKQLSLLLTLLEKKEDSLYFVFNYFSQENFILQYHIFILLFTLINSYEDLLFALQKLHLFTFGMLFNMFADQNRKKAFLGISNSFSNIKAVNSKEKSIKNKVYCILIENTTNACIQTCFCCRVFLNKLWLS